ncbi:dihydrofolate reductase family protein [Streptomyces prasinosporus]|uniref:Dihydrofolate reductase family protein n=2 Tax=Streptomyces TaxID=1883 RepID=A0ABP6UCN1_9ACTN|nr:deaminase reductase [Streptomyces albogriseolus]
MLSLLSKTTLPTCLYREGDGPAGRVGPEERRIMRKLVYTGFMSLDGLVDSPGGGPGEEHRSGGWVFKDLEFVEEAWSLKGEELADTTALMFGRRSYEAFASVWPGSQDHADYRDLPKYVVSSTLSEDALADGWGPTTVLRSTGDVAALKEGEGGAVFIHGSAELARRLSDAGLIDQYNLLMFPVLLGAGKSLFGRADRDKQMLALRESETYSNGIVKLVYDVRR